MIWGFFFIAMITVSIIWLRKDISSKRNKQRNRHYSVNLEKMPIGNTNKSVGPHNSSNRRGSYNTNRSHQQPYEQNLNHFSSWDSEHNETDNRQTSSGWGGSSGGAGASRSFDYSSSDSSSSFSGGGSSGGSSDSGGGGMD